MLETYSPELLGVLRVEAHAAMADLVARGLGLRVLVETIAALGMVEPEHLPILCQAQG